MWDDNWWGCSLSQPGQTRSGYLFVYAVWSETIFVWLPWQYYWGINLCWISTGRKQNTLVMSCIQKTPQFSGKQSAPEQAEHRSSSEEDTSCWSWAILITLRLIGIGRNVRGTKATKRTSSYRPCFSIRKNPLAIDLAKILVLSTWSWQTIMTWRSLLLLD